MSDVTVYSAWPFDADEAKRRQQETADALGVPVQKEIDLGTGFGINLVIIPAGRFMMGSDHPRPDAAEQPIHSVRITEPFYMSDTAILQLHYQAVMGENPSDFEEIGRPVECVSWNDARDFCEEISERTAQECRLPTEAQWEYACRAGSETAYFFGDSESRLDEYAWYVDNSDGQPRPGGQKKPNAWGLHDMCGNVLEWCLDFYDPHYYGKSPEEDPQGPSSGKHCALRGGCCWSEAGDCRSAFRVGFDPADTILNQGFRVVMSPTL